jgi:hypothetical protein
MSQFTGYSTNESVNWPNGDLHYQLELLLEQNGMSLQFPNGVDMGDETNSHLGDENDELYQESTQEQEFASLPDIIDEILGIECDNADDIFIPNPNQLAKLHAMTTQGNFVPNVFNTREWHDELWGDNGGALFQSLAHPNIAAIFEDQMQRAEALVNRMIQSGRTSIYFMDGHGRFLLCFIHALIEAGQDPDEYEINIVEKDETCNIFHELFFPKNVYAINANVLNQLTESIGNDEDAFFYLNFCSIGQTAINYGIDEFSDLLYQCAPMHNLMLSFTTRAMQRKGPIGRLVYDSIRPIWEYVSHRASFVTGFITDGQEAQAAQADQADQADQAAVVEAVDNEAIDFDIPDVYVPDDIDVGADVGADSDDEIIISRHSRKRRRIIEDDD